MPVSKISSTPTRKISIGGADRDSGYIYGPSLPRSWFVGAKISF